MKTELEVDYEVLLKLAQRLSNDLVENRNSLNKSIIRERLNNVVNRLREIRIMNREAQLNEIL